MSPRRKQLATSPLFRVSLTRWLIEKYVGQVDQTSSVLDPEVRARYAFLEAWVSIYGNTALSVLKILLGFLFNSISLLADAVHTAADVLTSAVVLLGFKMAQTPADEKHPHGHGRVEFLSTLLIAALLVVVGVQFGRSSYVRLVSRTPVKGSYAVAATMVVGAAFKEWMTRFAIFLGEKARSQALVGDAWHHRTDAIASFLVAIAMVSSRYGLYWIDAVLGLGVSALIVFTGAQLAVSSVSSLIGEKAPDELVDCIREAVLSCQGVRGLHQLVVHDYGGRKSISLHVLVSGDLSLIKSHEIATQVERAVKARIPADIVVHVEPEEAGTDN